MASINHKTNILAKKSHAVEDFVNHHAAISHEQTHAFPVDVTDEYRALWRRKLNFNWLQFGEKNPRRRRTESDNALFHSLSPLSTLFIPLEIVSQVHGVKPSISPRLSTQVEHPPNCWFPCPSGFCDAQ